MTVEAGVLRRLVWVLVLMTVASGARAGSGIGLRWGSCEGYSNRNFACDGSTGAEVLVASFSPPSGLDVVTGVSAFVRVSSATGTVPAWWQLSASGCRFGAITLSADMSDVSDCEDPWSGQAMGGLVGFVSDSDGLLFQVAVAVPPSAARTAGAGRSYAAFKLLVNHRRSAGPGACDGCNTPVCISLQAMTLGQPQRKPCNPVEDPGCGQDLIVLTQGIASAGVAGNVVTWQGGTPRCGAGGAKPATWSELKKRFHP